MANGEEIPVVMLHTPDTSGVLNTIYGVLNLLTIVGSIGVCYLFYQVAQDVIKGKNGGQPLPNGGSKVIGLPSGGSNTGGPIPSTGSKSSSSDDQSSTNSGNSNNSGSTSSNRRTKQYGLPTSFIFASSVSQPPVEPNNCGTSVSNHSWPDLSRYSQPPTEASNLTSPLSTVKTCLQKRWSLPDSEASTSAGQAPSTSGAGKDYIPRLEEYFCFETPKRDRSYKTYGLQDLSGDHHFRHAPYNAETGKAYIANSKEYSCSETPKRDTSYKTYGLQDLTGDHDFRQSPHNFGTGKDYVPKREEYFCFETPKRNTSYKTYGLQDLSGDHHSRTRLHSLIDPSQQLLQYQSSTTTANCSKQTFQRGGYNDFREVLKANNAISENMRLRVPQYTKRSTSTDNYSPEFYQNNKPIWLN